MTAIEGSLVACFEAHLNEVLATLYGDGTVDAAVRYVMQAGGKRVRPLVTMLAAEALGCDPIAALPAATAAEFVHTYSLVHDDLPCMDNDDFRRGRPTAHKQFGEAVALLAGDALLTDAFSIIAAAEKIAPANRVVIVKELADAAGGGGMVGGQALDLHWTARRGATREVLDELHLKKTGYLLGAAAAMGALSAAADHTVVERFRRFGRLLGLAFQIRDDLIDDLEATGKTRGKDKEAGKLTYLALMSTADAMAAADRLTEEALAILEFDGCRPARLKAVARALLVRRV